MSPLLPGALAKQAALPIHVLLVDDSPEFIESAARFLATDAGIEVTGRASTGSGALQLLEQLRIDLVLVDLIMPELSGLELTGLIKARADPPRVVILTLYDGSEYVAACQAAHADGCVAKSEFSTQLLPLIHALFGQGGEQTRARLYEGGSEHDAMAD